jgi:hypothetical protein
VRRIGELDREGRELSKLEDMGVEVHVSGYCRTCGMALIFNNLHYTWQGELDLGPVSVEWVDQDSVVRP